MGRYHKVMSFCIGCLACDATFEQTVVVLAALVVSIGLVSLLIPAVIVITGRRRRQSRREDTP